MAAIEALPGTKTVVMIAHRPSTVKICDRILVLDRDRLVGHGAWDDLLTSDHTFQRTAAA